MARVILGVGAGIAAYKACELLRRLTESGHDVTVVPTAAALRFEGDTIAEARLALGGVALKPWRAREAEQVLAGARRADASAFRRAAEAALASAKPSGDNGFKIELARRILARALMLAAAGTPERLPALPASPFAAISGAALHA